ncbi:hypothetical protein [Kitasatospora sp. P5_F3]
MAVTAAWNALTGLTRAAIRLSTVLMTPTGGLTVRSGVIPGGTPLLLTGSVMTGSVAPGRAVVQGTSAQGAYPVVVDAATPITVANGHASLSRIDTVFLVVLDADVDASGFRQASITYTQGTAGSGTAPTAPASGTAYLRLWDILVPANASAGTPINWGTALTDQRLYTVAVGGITPGAAAGSYAGQWRDAGGTAGILERWTGAVWEAAVRLGNSGTVALGDVALTRSAATTMQVGGSLKVTGTYTDLTSAFVEDTTTRTTTSTSYVDATTLTTTLIAPPSGKIRVFLTGKLQNNSSNPTFLGVQITGSTSGTIYAATDGTALVTVGADFIVQHSTRQATCTPGETVTFTCKARVAGGTGSLLYRAISAEAMPA